jgi:hypothetical protein
MAKLKNNIVFSGASGKIGDVIFKKYSYGTVISKIPDRSNVTLSTNQVSDNSKFKEAVAYAKSIINDPEKRLTYKRKFKRGRRMSVYHSAIKEYLKGKTSPT